MVLSNGRNMAAACRRLTPDVIKLLHEVITSETAAIPHRLRASEIVLDRAYGRPQQNIEIGGKRPTRSLSDQALMALAGADIEDGEFTEVEGDG